MRGAGLSRPYCLCSMPTAASRPWDCRGWRGEKGFTRGVAVGSRSGGDLRLGGGGGHRIPSSGDKATGAAGLGGRDGAGRGYAEPCPGQGLVWDAPAA